MTNLIDLDAHREPGAGRTNPATLYLEVFRRMEHSLIAHKLPDFHERFYIVKADTGRILVKALRSDDGIVEQCDQETLERAVAQYCTNITSHAAYAFTPRQIKECAAFWRLHTEEIPEPKAFLWPGELGLGYQRLPWPLAVGPTPTWDAVMAKVNNASAFKQWLGSLFYPDSNMHQYVWMYGQGGDGKGAINRFFRRVFGRAFHSGLPPQPGKENFWVYYSLIGKRLVVFPDCEDPDFITSGIFMSLTGGDPIAAEKKFGDLFTYSPAAKYLVSANVRPNLKSTNSDMRRVILVEFEEGKFIDSQDFEAALWNEGGAFLADCMAEYLKHNPDRTKKIKTDDAGIRNWVDHLEEEFASIFESAFAKSPTTYVTAADMQLVLASWFGSSRKRKAEFSAWLKRVHKVESRVLRKIDALDGSKVVRGYQGLSLINSKFTNSLL